MRDILDSPDKRPTDLIHSGPVTRKASRMGTTAPHITTPQIRVGQHMAHLGAALTMTRQAHALPVTVTAGVRMRQENNLPWLRAGCNGANTATHDVLPNPST